MSNNFIGHVLDQVHEALTMVGVLDTDGKVKALSVDPTTGRLRVDAAVSGIAEVNLDKDSDEVAAYGGVDGVDGTRVILHVDSAGRLKMVGAAAAGAAPVGNPVFVAGTDGTLLRGLKTDASGELQIDVLSSALPAGAATLAEQQTQTTSLSVMDDWDESDRAKVNPIVGQAGVQGASGLVTANTQRVVLATDVPLPSGTNNIGDVDVLTEPATAADGALGLPAVIKVTGGYDGANVQVFITDDSGNAGIFQKAGTQSHGDGTSALVRVPFAVDGTTLTTPVREWVYNGTTYDRARGDTLGKWVQGPVADGTAIGSAGKPVLIAGTDGTALQTVATHTDGYIQQTPRTGDTALPDNLSNTIRTVQSTDGTAIRHIVFPYVFDGTSWDRMAGTSADGLLVNLGTNNDVNVTQWAGNAVTTGAGAVAAGTLRTTLASDDPAVASLAIIDDWDETDRAKVNPIVGQAGVQGGAGAATTNTQRVAIATDANAVTQAGTWTVQQGTPPWTVEGVVADGGTLTGTNPVLIGASDGSVVQNIISDTTGRLVVVGAAGDGVAVSGAPVRIGGKDPSGNTQDILTSTSGALAVATDSVSTVLADGLSNTMDLPTDENGTSVEQRVVSLVFNGTTWDRPRGNTTGVASIGGLAHDAVDTTGNQPIKIGGRAVAHNTSPTAVAAADVTHFIANRHGIPFVQPGHPNIISTTLSVSAAQSNFAILSAGAGQKIVLTGISVALDEAATVGVGVSIGFGATTTPSQADGTPIVGSVINHQGLVPGGGIVREGGGGIIGVGADGEDLRITSTVATGGNLTIMTSHYLIES